MTRTGTPFRRVAAATTTPPGRAAWCQLALELLWLLPVIGLLGAVGGFLEFEVTRDLRGLLAVAAIALVMPALGEELLFRAAILPRAEEGRAFAPAAAISIAAFTAWHPLQAMLFGPDRATLFVDPWFLGAVAALGLALARLYRASQSLWPCLMLHWLVVVGWKAFFGGPPNPFL